MSNRKGFVVRINTQLQELIFSLLLESGYLAGYLAGLAGCRGRL